MSSRSCRTQHGSTTINVGDSIATSSVGILDAAIGPAQAFVITSLSAPIAAPNRAFVIPTLLFYPQSSVQFLT